MLDRDAIEMEHLLPDEYTFISIREQLLADIITLCLTYEIDEDLTDELLACIVVHYNKVGEIL